MKGAKHSGSVYINNPILVMVKNKLIESLRTANHTTIRYKGLKIRLRYYFSDYKN